MRDLGQQLRLCLPGRVCLLGLGNVDYGDDGFGVRLAERLLAAGVPDVIVAGSRPERWIGRIAESSYDNLLFLDAVNFGGEPGAVVLLEAREMRARFPQVSTHKIALGTLAALVEASGITKAWLLGVQPESMNCRELTSAVRATLEVLADLLRSLKSQGSPSRAGFAHAGAEPTGLSVIRPMVSTPAHPQAARPGDPGEANV